MGMARAMSHETIARAGINRGALHAGVALALVRALSSYSWLDGALWGKDAKFAPDFLRGAGLTQRITTGKTAFVHTTLVPGVASFLTGTVVPHASLFAWLIALGELVTGCSLLLGLFARLGGALAISQALVNIVIAGGGSQDTLGHNYMLLIVGLGVLLAAAGRTYGLDRLLIERYPSSRLLRLVS